MRTVVGRAVHRRPGGRLAEVLVNDERFVSRARGRATLPPIADEPSSPEGDHVLIRCWHPRSVPPPVTPWALRLISFANGRAAQERMTRS